MADLDWFPVEPGRYLKNTLHLTTRQHGAYWLWIFAAFEARGELPGTDAGLMAAAKLTPKEWKEDGGVLKAFLTREGDRWVHEFARFLREDAEQRVAGKSKAGKAGAAKRWNGRRKGDAMAPPSSRQWQTDAQLQVQEEVSGEPPEGLPPEEHQKSSPVAAREDGPEGADAHDINSLLTKIAAGKAVR